MLVKVFTNNYSDEKDNQINSIFVERLAIISSDYPFMLTRYKK